MWDKSFAEGRIEELPVEIDEEEDLAFSEDFYKKFCEIKET